jgi:DNA adenine methylase
VTDARIKAIAPWFGGKRTMAPVIVQELGKHTQYFEPFCGSMAVLFAKEPSQKETVNDLHGDLINLARVLQNEDEAPRLYDRLQSVLFSEDLLEQARHELGDGGEFPPLGVTKMLPERAYWYFLASWMGRNGTAGTERVDYQLAVRWTKSGGSSTVRWRNAVDSIPWWHQRLRNVVIMWRDAFRIIDRFEDCEATAIYVDSPYHASTRTGFGYNNGANGRYLHEFDHGHPFEASLLDPASCHKCGRLKAEHKSCHERLAEVLRTYKKARVVVSYYDCPEVRKLYKGWTFVEHTRRKHLHAQNGRGAPTKEAPEVLIINGPSYAEAA